MKFTGTCGRSASGIRSYPSPSGGHLVRTLDQSEETKAADLVNRIGGLAESARELAYRLNSVCERKRWAKQALAYTVVGNKARWDGRSLAEWVPEAAQCIAEAFSPRKILLFGSVARGDDGPDSDLDFLVVFDHLDGRRHDVGVAILRATSEIGAPIDVFVTDLADIAQRGSDPGLLRVALREGRVVHERAG